MAVKMQITEISAEAKTVTTNGQRNLRASIAKTGQTISSIVFTGSTLRCFYSELSRYVRTSADNSGIVRFLVQITLQRILAGALFGLRCIRSRWKDSLKWQVVAEGVNRSPQFIGNRQNPHNLSSLNSNQ